MKSHQLSIVFLCAFCGILTFLSGCGTSGVMQLSADTYMISKTSAAGAFASRSGMQADAIREANEFAQKKGKVAVTRGSNWERPAQGFPTFEYQFILVDKDDPRATGVSLTPRPDLVIEKTEKITGDIRTKNDTENKADLYTELTKLDDLRKKGIITDAEFNTQKQKLLSK
jgi:hypothetical protein